MKPSDLIRLALHLRSILDAFDRYHGTCNVRDEEELTNIVEREGAAALALIMSLADGEADRG